MGENNAIFLANGQRRVSRDTFIAAAAIYQSIYGNEHGVPATFQVFLCH
jgi:NADH dehydrogenase [ubiquinone] 1 alpha subcomplex assembly factor 5